MSEETKQPEFDVGVGPTGVTARTKGYRLSDIAIMVIAGSIIYIGVMLQSHEATAARENSNIVAVIKEQVQLQRETLNAQREANCLSRLDSKNRREADIEFCRNLGKGR